jgi:hypothetical protein
MGQQAELQTLLKSLADTVYFQPPPNTQMSYPAIVYELDAIDTTFANNLPYNRTKRYQVTIMDTDPEGVTSDKVGALPMSSFARRFVADGIVHDVYRLYF